MPSSKHTLLTPVLNLIMELEPKSILDVGVGFGRMGFLLREYLDVWEERYNKEDWEIKITGVEAHPPYIGPLQRLVYDKIITQPLENVVDRLEHHELVFMGEVLEHFDRETGKTVLKKLWEKCDTILITTPLEPEEQAEAFGNPYEEHKSAWTPEELVEIFGTGYWKVVDSLYLVFWATKGASQAKSHVLICGQPRSGAKTFWRQFRKDERFTCFDEPFRPDLRAYLHRRWNNWEKTMDEYFETRERRNLIHRYWSSLPPAEQTVPTLVQQQRHYVQELLRQGTNVCLDTVRCNNKLESFRNIAPKGLIIHLLRDPRAVVTSHLRPYRQWWVSGELPESFFEYQGGFNKWEWEALANELKLTGSNSIVRMLKVWKWFTDAAQAAAPDLTIHFEELAISPLTVMKRIYDKLDLEYVPQDHRDIQLPQRGWEPDNPKWEPLLEEAEIDRTQLGWMLRKGTKFVTS